MFCEKEVAPLPPFATVRADVNESEEAVMAPAVREPRVAPPTALSWELIVVEPVTARAVVVAEEKVAPWKVARPVWVVAPKVAPPSAFSWELIVVEPVTAKLVLVAPWREVAPLTVSEESVASPPEVSVPKVAPPTAFSTPVIVVDAKTAKLPVVGPFAREKFCPVRRPMLLMEKSVLCAPLLEVEAIAKSVVVAVVEAAKMLKSAVGFGVEEPMERPFLKDAASK